MDDGSMLETQEMSNGTFGRSFLTKVDSIFAKFGLPRSSLHLLSERPMETVSLKGNATEVHQLRPPVRRPPVDVKGKMS